MNKHVHFEDVIRENGKLIYTNEGNSMFPLILPRDLLVIEAVKKKPALWDVPLYKRDSGQYVLHRIVGVTDSGYVMCGDNRFECEYGITDRHIIGILTAIVRNGETIPFEQLPNYNMVKATEDIRYLLTCALHEESPAMERVKTMNPDSVYRLADENGLVAAVAMALEQIVPLPRPFDQAKKKAIRKLALFDIERDAVFNALETAGIWYLPLKGVVLGELYPKRAMREMGDNDILCDPERMEDVKAIMEQCGYVCVLFGESHHDVYSKPPSLEFEMHRALFRKEESPRFVKYYADISKRLLPDGAYRRQMRDEDVYIYLLCHMYKHKYYAGTGMRSLLDICVWNRAKPHMDRDYLRAELGKLRLQKYEAQTRSFAEKVFSTQPLGSDDQKELLRYAVAGARGTQEELEYHQWEKQLGGDTLRDKSRYWRKRVFLSGESLQKSYPAVAKHKVLYPLLLLYRPIKGVLTHPKQLAYDIKTVKHFKKRMD